MVRSDQNIPRKIIKNTIYNASARAWGIAVSLFLTPYIVHHIGREQFGVWAIIGMVTGYFGLLDLGVETGFVKYISEFYAKKEFHRINQLVNTGIIFYSILMLVLFAVMAMSIDSIFSFLKISMTPGGEVKIVFWTCAVMFCLSNALSPLIAIQNGLQRMDLFNKVSVCLSMVTVVGTMYFLEKGYGLKGLVFTSALVFCCSSTINIILAFRIFPQLRLNPRLFNAKELVRLFNYGYKLQVSRFANLISFQADNLLISHFLGVGMVTYYQLGTSVIQQSRQFVLLLISALIPAVSELRANNDLDRLEDLYLRGSKYLICLSVPLTCFLVIEAPLIMTVWMGKGYGLSAVVIQILSTGYCAATVTGVASAIAAGSGRTEIDMKFGLLMASMNLFLGIVLIIKFGFVGLLIATAVSLIVSSAYFIHLFHKKVSIVPLGLFLQLIRTPSLCSIVPAFIILTVNFTLHASLYSGDRVVNGCCLVLNGVFFAFSYTASLLKSGCLDSYDTTLLRERIPFIKRILSYAH